MPTVPRSRCRGGPSTLDPCTPSGQICPQSSPNLITIEPPYENNVCSLGLGDQIAQTGITGCTSSIFGTFLIADPTFLDSIGPEWSIAGGDCSICSPPNVLTYQRTRFDGNPTTCCLQDYVCNLQNPASCFSSPGRADTCDPIYRDASATPCQPLIQTHCLGLDLLNDDRSWITRWSDGTCPRAVERIYYNNCPRVDAGITTERFKVASGIVTGAIDKYQKQGFVLGALPGFPGYSDAQNRFYDICKKTPGLCPMRQICSSQTTDSVSRNPLMLQWCGCHLPPDQYAKYTNQYQINPECTPTCNRPDVIPTADIAGTGKIRCEESFCLIDNLTITLASTDLTGGINIGQFCGSCSGAECSCIISDTSIDIANSEIGGGINLTQACGGSALCLRTNPVPGLTPGTIEVPCSVDPSFNPFAGQEEAIKKAERLAQQRKDMWILVVLGLVVIGILVISFYRPRK